MTMKRTAGFLVEADRAFHLVHGERPKAGFTLALARVPDVVEAELCWCLCWLLSDMSESSMELICPPVVISSLSLDCISTHAFETAYTKSKIHVTHTHTHVSLIYNIGVSCCTKLCCKSCV